MKIKMEIKIKIFFNFDIFKLFIISWKNFFRRIFQEIINKDEADQYNDGYINKKVSITLQFQLNHVDVDGSKMENKLFII